MGCNTSDFPPRVHLPTPAALASAYAWLRGFLYTYVPDNRAVQEDEDGAAASGSRRGERRGLAGLASQAISAARQRCAVV